MNTFLDTDENGDVIKNDRNTKVADHDEYLQKQSDASKVVTSTAAVFKASSDATKCVVCAKSVGLAEQRLACQKTWHADCFTCGGLQSDGCGKKLTLDNYRDHDLDPYCVPCYNKLFGTKGFIGASSMNNFIDEPSDDRIVNDRNTRAIETEALPQSGGVKAAMAALKQQLPKA